MMMYSADFAYRDFSARKRHKSDIKNRDAYVAFSIYVFYIYIYTHTSIVLLAVILSQTPTDYPKKRARRKRDRDREKESMGNKLLPASGDNWKSYHTCRLFHGTPRTHGTPWSSKFSSVRPSVATDEKTPAGTGPIFIRRFKTCRRYVRNTTSYQGDIRNLQNASIFTF